MEKYNASEKKICILHKDGLTNRKIAEALKVPHWFIGRKIRSLNLSPNGRKRGKREVNGNKSKCSVCGVWYPTHLFPKGRSGKSDQYFLTYCRLCRKSQMIRSMNSDVGRYINDKWNRTRQRAKKLGIAFNISKDDFLKQFEKQNGKCFFTDQKLITIIGEGRFPNSASVDKLIPTKGYIRGNVVFVTNQVNTIKSNISLKEMELWMPDWFKRTKNFISLT